MNTISVTGSSSSVDTQGTDIVYKLGVPKSSLAVSHNQYSVQDTKSSQSLFSADFTVSHGHTADEPRTAEEREESADQKSLFDHNLMLSLQQIAFFIDKKTILKVASLMSLLNGGFNTE